MTHQEISKIISNSLAQADDIEDTEIESIIGGVAMTLAIMMHDTEIYEIEVGPHTITLS